MQNEIVKTDRQYRKRLFIAYGIVLAVLACFITIVLPIIISEIKSLPVRSVFAIMETGAIVFLLLFIGPAFYIIHIGRTIIKHRCVPYPGMKVIRDTLVISGERAIKRGRMLVILGIISVTMAILGSWSTYYFFTKFRNDPLFRGILKDVVPRKYIQSL